MLKTTQPGKPGGNVLLAGVAALVIQSATVLPALSQEPTQAEDQELVLEEITVTARRREESLQDVPIQVSAFSAQDIQDAGITNTQDFVNLVPNVSLDDSFTYLNTFVVIRGVAQINNADAPLAIVIDGVPQNNQKQFKMNLFDIERIEVLKGPQGALYGRNAIGGAVNIVTRQPGNDFEGSIAGRYGNGDAIETWGSLSGPIVKDKALFRIAGFYKQDDGRIDNTFLNQKSDFVDHDYNIRGKLAVFPSENLSLDFRAAYRDFRAGSIYDSAVFSGNANDYQKPSEDFLGATFGNITELTFKFDADFDFATLTGITGYTHLKEAYRGDLDFTNPVNNPGGFLGFLGPVGQGQDLNVELTSQELRLVSPDDKRLRWIVGVYYIRTDRQLQTRVFFDLDHTPGQIDNPALTLVNLNEDNNNTAWAGFGQVDFDITDRLTVSAALRYDKDRRKQRDLNSGLIRKASFDAVQPKITITYHFDDERLAYATYSTGFRSGGFNAPGIPIFRDETLDNLETGFKSSWLNKRLIVNGAFYYAFVDDFQFFFVDVATASQVISNINKVEIFGVELEFQALVAPGLEVFGALGTTDSQIKKNLPLPATVGNKTPKTTTWTANLGFQYRAPLANGFMALVRVDYEHRGKKYWQADNLDIQKPVDLLNIRTGVEGTSWGLYFWGRNITGQKYFTDFNPREFSGLPIDIGFLAQPATYGVEGRIRF